MLTARQRVLLIFVGIGMFLFGLSVSVTFFSEGDESPRSQLQIKGTNGETQIESGPGALTAAAELIFQYEFPEGDGVIRVSPIPESWVGQPIDAEKMHDLFSSGYQWDLVSIDPERIRIRVFCKDLGTEGYLSVKNGRVAIYDGDPDGCAKERMVTDIETGSLADFQKIDLETELVFKNPTELHLILDGLTSLP